MIDLLRIVLPLIWAVLAALIGWFLYRYGTVKIETRWAAITGAVVIALLFFYGMYRVTPGSITECIAPGATVVLTSDAARVRALARDLRQDIASVREACTRTPRRDDRCAEALDALEAREVRITEGMQRLLGTGGPATAARGP